MSVAARTVALVAFLFLMTAITAHADTFTYALNLNSGEFTFTVVSPTLIKSDTTYTAGITCNYMLFQDCRSVEINPFLGFVDYQIYVRNQLGFNTYIPLPLADFVAPGVYTVPMASGTFSIIDNPSTVTPEPSSLVLLATGLAGLAGTIRRRCRAV